MRVYRISRVAILSEASADFFSKPDLFVSLSYGKQCIRSAVRWECDVFEFTGPFLFEYEAGVFDLRVQVFDKDRWSPDELLLEAVFDTSKAGVFNCRGVKIEVAIFEALSTQQLAEIQKKNSEVADALVSATRASLQLSGMTAQTPPCRHEFVVDRSDRAEHTVYICALCGVDRRFAS